MAKIKIEAEVDPALKEYVRLYAKGMGVSEADVVRMSVIQNTGWRGGVDVGSINRARKAKRT